MSRARARAASCSTSPLRIDEKSVFYETSDLDFAAYLSATERLEFDHVEQRRNHGVFLFRDPAKEGSSIFREYNLKELAVPARLLLAARRQLLNAIRASRGL